MRLVALVAGTTLHAWAHQPIGSASGQTPASLVAAEAAPTVACGRSAGCTAGGTSVPTVSEAGWRDGSARRGWSRSYRWLAADRLGAL